MKTLPVFYSPFMVAPSASYSPSAEKPAQVVASWQRRQLPITISAPEPSTVAELAAAHAEAYVRRVLSCEIENGFGNRSPAVAAALPWTSGAMLSAARWARTNGGAAVAPCSGFHHARYARGEGFCTFNGLMVAAAALRRDGALRVGILDCDYHYGDGTDAIIDSLDAHAWVQHYTAGATYGRPSQAAAFLRELPAIVDSFAGCDVVLYQAGADAHRDDPLGGFLSSEELGERDAIVFSRLAALNVPVAWSLAGGYQRDASGGISTVLAVHDRTLVECARVHVTGA